MFREVSFLLGCGLLACTGARSPEVANSPGDDVRVEHDSELRETHYRVASGDCAISWTVYETEVNRGVVRHRSDCGLTLAEQAPLIGKVLREVLSAVPAEQLRTLTWGRLYPDGAGDTTMAVRLALAALRSEEWDALRGAPRNDEINAWVRELADDAVIHRELVPVFEDAGLEISLTSVEKVLVLEAGELPFFEILREAGAEAGDRLPYDCQTWFSVRQMHGTDQ